jgi:hypothetical protein
MAKDIDLRFCETLADLKQESKLFSLFDEKKTPSTWLDSYW